VRSNLSRDLEFPPFYSWGMSYPEEANPLLSPPGVQAYPTAHEQDHLQHVKSTRYVENDVLPETATVGRNIGWGSAYIIVISRVIGSGIFAMPGTILKSVGSPHLALTLWIVGAFVAWCGLAISLEYGCMLPRSGGEKVYLEYTYRRPRFLASTLVAVQAVLLGFSASNCIVFSEYTLFALKVDPTDVAIKSLAIGLLTAITIVHGCFYRAGIWIQNVLGWAKVALIIFMIMTALFAVAFEPNGNSSTVTRNTRFAIQDLWSGSELGWGVLSMTFFKISYSYAGLANINNVLNEVKNPVRTLKTVGPAALLTACVMYVLVNLAYLAVVPVEEIKRGGELVAALFFQRVFGSGFGNVFLPLTVAISATGNVMVVTFSLVSDCNFILVEHFADSFISGSTKPRGCPARLFSLL
jgi:amino acid transporter